LYDPAITPEGVIAPASVNEEPGKSKEEKPTLTFLAQLTVARQSSTATASNKSRKAESRFLIVIFIITPFAEVISAFFKRIG